MNNKINCFRWILKNTGLDGNSIVAKILFSGASAIIAKFYIKEAEKKQLKPLKVYYKSRDDVDYDLHLYFKVNGYYYSLFEYAIHLYPNKETLWYSKLTSAINPFTRNSSELFVTKCGEKFIIEEKSLCPVNNYINMSNYLNVDSVPYIDMNKTRMDLSNV